MNPVSTATRPRAAGPPRPAPPRFALRRRARRGLLVLHLVSAGAWIGIDVVVAVLVGVGWFGADRGVRGLAYQALATFVVWPMLTSALVCLVTGIVLGWGTKWGLLRYWWVAVKLALNLLMCALILFVLAPRMGAVAGYGRDLAAGRPADPTGVSSLFFPPAVSLTLLTFATVLSVVKPWGRIRATSRRRPAGTAGSRAR